MPQDNTTEAPATPLALTVPDLVEALDFFTHRLGFRVEMIVPADAPETAVVSGQGLTLRLLTGEQQAALTDSAPEEFVIGRLPANEVWRVGRAGMYYRDLLPSRLGGRFAASHIRIPDGGPVPDYVHYHKVRLQMIYCKAGWVRVVYEDQGPPFVLEAGDCVLQPPEIRHRVLEASPGLEVIEISSPAVHETWADHELELPTRAVLPDRLFNGQRFVRHQARAARWQPWRLAGFSACDTGVAAATNGLAAAHIVKAAANITAAASGQAGEIFFFFVLQGELRLESELRRSQQLQAGDSCLIAAGVGYTLQASAGLELLEVMMRYGER